MPFIEIITDSKSQTQLNKVITKKMVNDCDILFIKDKNIENTKNIKLETLVLNRSVENDELMSKIMKNSKNLILNLDLNENLHPRFHQTHQTGIPDPSGYLSAGHPGG